MSATTRTSRAPARPREAPRLREEPGVRYGLGHVWLCVSVLVAHGLGLPDLVVLVVAVSVVLASCRGLGLAPAVGLGAATWAVWTGFVEHRLGVLTLALPDLARLGLVVLVCAVAAPRPRPWARLAPW